MRKHFLFYSILVFVVMIGLLYNKPLFSLLKYKRVEAALQTDLKAPGLQKSYDLIVVGGEPEGVAAAVSAARNGVKTLLIENRPGLGGLATYGMLNFLDQAYDKKGKNLNQGIFAEWHKMVGDDFVFDIDQANNAFLQLVQQEPNITLELNTSVVSAKKEGSTITDLTIRNSKGKYDVTGKYFIDATQDADLSAMAGAPFFVGGEDINLKHRSMSATPIIHLKGVDWGEVSQTAKSKKFGDAFVSSSTANGFGKMLQMYKPVDKDTRVRGMNIVHISHLMGQDDVYINALQVFGVDGLSEQSKQAALEKGKQEMNHFLEYLRSNFPGFEHAEIASYPTELYIRETRHINSEYQLSMADVWENKDQPDSIGYGGYPVDIQATSPNDFGYVMAKPIQYAIPFRSIVPLNISNLLVVGRSSGYSSLADGSARTIPTGMTTGEAAGVATSVALKKGILFPDLSKDQDGIAEVRDQLQKQGARVDHFNVGHPYEGQWFDSDVSFLINYGLLCAGYDNNLYPDKTMSTIGFSQLLEAGTTRIDLNDQSKPLEQTLQNYINGVKDKKQPITRDQALSLILDFYNKPGTTTWDEAYKEHLIDQELYQRIPQNRAMTQAEAYDMAAHTLENFKKTLQ